MALHHDNIQISYVQSNNSLSFRITDAEGMDLKFVGKEKKTFKEYQRQSRL